MAPPNERDVYDARCLRIASAAAALGVSIAKSVRRGERALKVSGNGHFLEFSIVTDERMWRETSVEQAFYSVLLDARGWEAAHVDDASLATIVDESERAEIPLIRKDLAEELARIEELAKIVGGRAHLEDLWQNVELTNV